MISVILKLKQLSWLNNRGIIWINFDKYQNKYIIQIHSY